MKRVASLLLLTAFTSQATTAPPGADLLFAHRVLPLLKAKCFACHGADPKQRKAAFDMRTRAGLLRGGASGEPAVVPGQPIASPLYQAVTRRDTDNWPAMPPKENDRLSRQQVAAIADWISGGAPWPAAQRLAELRKRRDPWDSGEGVRVKTSGGLTAEWTNRAYDPRHLWAYQPLRWPPPPNLDGHPIDAFMVARRPEGLAAAASADRLTLIRRATFDLLGLPPTPEQIAAFADDAEPDAYERLLKRLLASPHYGEQWGRHWLDVVRYADSAGFANDFERPTPGAIETMSSAPSIKTNRTTNSSVNKSRATKSRATEAANGASNT